MEFASCYLTEGAKQPTGLSVSLISLRLKADEFHVVLHNLKVF